MVGSAAPCRLCGQGTFLRKSLRPLGAPDVLHVGLAGLFGPAEAAPPRHIGSGERGSDQLADLAYRRDGESPKSTA